MSTNIKIPETTHIGGDVFNSFIALNDLIVKNDGVRKFQQTINSCYDSDVPFTDDKQTHVRITNNLNDINQLSDAFINMKLKVNIQLNKTFTAAAAFPDTLKLFVGLKNSNELIRQLELENNNVDTNYLQTEGTREGFAFSVYKPKSEKVIKKYSHSLYNNVHNYDNSICGKAFDPTTFTINTPQDVEFNVVIPINDLLALQCLEDWPRHFGDIVLKYYINKNALVWCQIDPTKVAQLHNYVHETITDTNLALVCGNIYKYDRKFTQIGMPAKVITGLAETTAVGTIEEATLSVNYITVNECKVTIPGYSVTQECMKKLQTLFTPEKPFIIPSQQIDVRNFGLKPNAGGIDTDFSYALHNVTDCVLAFPKDSRQLTCLENPMLNELQLNLDGKLYPEKAIETVGERFFTMMLNASDLDGLFECTEEYEDSLTRSLNKENGTKLVRTYKDQTSFLCTIQTERNGAGLFFDGLESGNTNVTVGLHAKPMFTGTNDTYCGLAITPPPPQVWFTRDTYWSWDPQNGLKYHKTGTPEPYKSDADIF